MLDIKVIERIINNSDIEDLTIMNKNYESLIKDSDSDESKNRFIILRTVTEDRIKQLKVIC